MKDFLLMWNGKLKDLPIREEFGILGRPGHVLVLGPCKCQLCPEGCQRPTVYDAITGKVDAELTYMIRGNNPGFALPPDQQLHILIMWGQNKDGYLITPNPILN